MNNFLSNYPDIIKEALIPMIIGIFAFCFPLLFQTISRIDKKYESTKLIETFRKDWICKCFLWILLSTIASYVIWLFQIPSLVNINNFALVLVIINTIALITVTLLIETLGKDWMCKWFLWILFSTIVSEVLWIFQISSPKYFVLIIDNSALILVIINTIALITMTFFIVYLTYIYYVPKLLLNRLIKIYNKTKKTLYFEAISKILFYSIDKADESLARTLIDFYADVFVQIKKKQNGNVIVYPQEYYDTIFEANELLCKRDKCTISLFNEGALFDLFLDKNISQNTYHFIWQCLIQSVRYDRCDIVFAYWRKAHQLFSLFTSDVFVEYDDNTLNIDEKNKAEIDKREKKRKDFLEFHYVLGGLLMYKQKYKVVKEIMNYTQQLPPRYVLVPERMQQVIEQYMQITKNENTSLIYYRQRYQFPDIYGIDSDSEIQMWIKRYLAVLFIRQYTLLENYINFNPLTMPQPPENLSELNRWKNELDGLEYFVNDYLSKKDILEKIGLEEFCSSDLDWFKKNNKEKPSVLISNLKNQIEEKFNKIKTEQPIDLNKEKEFQEETVKYLTPIFDKYKNIFNNDLIENYQSHFIGGRFDILPKVAFAKNQDIGYSNTDSVTAQGVNMEFQYYAINTFVFISPQRYLMIEKDLFLAIDRLNIDSENFAIISVGLNIKYFSYLQIDGLLNVEDKWYYKEMEIFEINNNSNDLVNQSLFVLKKEDLPRIIFNETKKEKIDKYHLEKIDKKYNIYAKLNDLNEPQNQTIKEELEQKNYQVNLSELVLACVNINIEIQYKPKAKCIQLKAFLQFDDRGKANKLEDIQPY